MLQFITNTASPVSVVDQIKGVIAGGCRWIQIRMKDATDEEITDVVNQIKPLCLETESFLIMNDRVELAKKLDVGGVHLGKMDMLPSKARIELGPAAVIGCTANTIEDIKAVQSLDIDYIGIGPFRFTETKKNLSPVLGIEGIEDICKQMRELEINIPKVAVGGIRKEDIDALMSTGIDGLAVSGAIAFADDIKRETEEFLKKLTPYEKEGNND